MDWTESETIRFFRPGIADSLVGCKAAQGLKTLGEVISIQECRKAVLELVVAVVVIAPDSDFLEGRFIHSTGPLKAAPVAFW